MHVDSVSVITRTDCGARKRFCTSVPNYFSLSESAHTHSMTSLPPVWTSQKEKCQTSYICPTRRYICESRPLSVLHRDIHTIFHIFSSGSILCSGALAGHRCLLAASSSGGSLKHRRGRGAAALRVQRTQPGFSAGRHPGEANSSNNKEKKQRI